MIESISELKEKLGLDTLHFNPNQYAIDFYKDEYNSNYRVSLYAKPNNIKIMEFSDLNSLVQIKDDEFLITCENYYSDTTHLMSGDNFLHVKIEKTEKKVEDEYLDLHQEKYKVKYFQLCCYDGQPFSQLSVGDSKRIYRLERTEKWNAGTMLYDAENKSYLYKEHEYDYGISTKITDISTDYITVKGREMLLVEEDIFVNSKEPIDKLFYYIDLDGFEPSSGIYSSLQKKEYKLEDNNYEEVKKTIMAYASYINAYNELEEAKGIQSGIAEIKKHFK